MSSGEQGSDNTKLQTQKRQPKLPFLLSESANNRQSAVLLAQFLHGPQVGCGFSKTSGGGGVIELGALLVESLFCSFLRFFCSYFVNITSTDSRVGENLDHARLNFQEATGDVEHLFGLVLLDHPNRARLEIGQQRCVTRQNA